MEMRNFILHQDILSVEVTIDKKDYIIGVQWKTPEKLMVNRLFKLTGASGTRSCGRQLLLLMV
ncbi:hypothetical protein [Halalkalibacter akibai]|uniref:Uncharacterized protein n=1 Tax=Halalkalibacter akibai (strain ATCC 43226 / DSM 21942 / CIP 109018 / JCM 9157 / 1139) TaxID=1236973 RepID=W4QZ08_HALA3|nr:hypothetical protein [Halalkalibacter akibai]GAE37142.1 hypothetical protein JCM9157_4391 [Halalkalibacter akibai JCM 9157]